jgi:acetylornithine deacetylase
MDGTLGEVTGLLRELVAVDSSSQRSNEAVVELLRGRLERLGFALRLQRFPDELGVEKVNLLALSHGSWEQPAALALVGHTDCVPFDPSWPQALQLTEQAGKWYGRGACDTKGFIACAMVAAARVHNDKKLARPLLLVFTADEEVGCLGAKKVVEARAVQAHRAIVGEPTSLTPVRGHKGYCLAEVEISGREGHSAYPQSGRSAIFWAARFLRRLEELSRTELAQEKASAFQPPYTTVNVGLIHGGTARNIIPGHCLFTVEWRPIPNQPSKRVLELLEHIKAEQVHLEADYRAEIRFVREDPGLDTPEAAELVRFLAQESGNAAATVSFGTEAPYFTQLGAESVVFGPGNIQVAHQTGEFVPTEELARCEQVLERAIVHFCAAQT